MSVDVNALIQAPNAILAIVVVLGLAILFHESGHFFTARLCGVGVEEFAVGFGPILWRRRWGATTYSLRVLPFGGFARIAGMEPGTFDDPDGLYAKPRWMQAAVFAGGSAMNLVLALLFFLVVILWRGVPDPTAVSVLVERTLPGTPAAAAGFMGGDEIVAIDGYRRSAVVEEVLPGSLAERWGLAKNYSIYSVDGTRVAMAGELARVLGDTNNRRHELVVVNPDAERIPELYVRLSVEVPASVAKRLADAASSPSRAEAAAAKELGVTWAPLTTGTLADYIAVRPGKPLTITVLRQGEQVEITVRPRPVWERVAEPGASGTLQTPHRQVGRIGVVLSTPLRRPGVGEAIVGAARATVDSVVLMINAIRAMIMREISPELGGPVAIMAVTAEQAKIGWAAVLNWGGLISANLAIVNLLPIPPFDGFHLVMVGWEAVTRRRINERVRAAIMVAGFMIVIAIFAAFTYNDILNLLRYRTP